MILTLISQNVEYGALDQGRWPRLVDAIMAHEPDFVALQEVDWLADAACLRDGTTWAPGQAPEAGSAERAAYDRAVAGIAERARVGDQLGGRVIVGPSRNLSTAVAYRHNPAVRLAGVDVKYADDVHHGYTAPRFLLDGVRDADGVEVPLVVVSAHLNPFSAAAAAQEAQLLAARAYRYGGLAVILGDINHMGVHDPEPDWAKVKPYNRSSRCLARASTDEPWRGNRIVGQVLRDAELDDVAARLATERDDPRLLAPTGRHGLLRVDQAHATPALAPAIIDYEVIDPGPDASDHLGILFRIDTDLIDTTLLLTYT